MNKTSILSKLMMGAASLTLSAGVWATSSTDMVTDPMNDLWGTTVNTTKTTADWSMDWGMDKMNLGMDRMNDPEYLVTDKDNQKVKFLDGVDKGRMVSDDGAMRNSMDCMKGDTITNLKTKKSGVIKGVKHQGTMDVVAPSGKTVRYQYVIFKVKPVK
ncbi:MAG: hypothetical protein K0U37_03450 [Gammaproteobacteria bacterium]|nr:hypothetical protein [Gammaproteobacteria bacterium]